MTPMDIALALYKKGYSVKKFASEFGFKEIVVKRALTKTTIPGEECTRAREALAKILDVIPERIWGKNFVKAQIKTQIRRDLFIENRLKTEQKNQDRIEKALKIKDENPRLSWKQIAKGVGLSPFNIYKVSREINKRLKSNLTPIDAKELKESLTKIQITQAEIARRLGVSRQYINEVIQGRSLALWTRIDIKNILLDKQNHKKKAA